MPRKYVSITELLDNVSLGPADAAMEPGRAAAGGRRSRPRRGARRHVSAQQFVNMSCRFVVRPGTPMPPPDEIVEADAVLRIVAQPTNCPICLEPAVVPRMLSCGHIMCLPCFYRFLRHAEDRVCPACGEPVPARVTNVSFLPADPRFLPQLDHEVVLRLVARTDGGFPSPVDTKVGGVVEQLLYSRIVYGTTEYCRNEAYREIKQLEAAREEAHSDEDASIEQALAACRADMSAAAQVVAKRPPPAETKPGTLYYYQTGFEAPTTYVLAPLDIAVLKASFGNYADFPPLLVAKVDNIVHRTVDEDVRKRMKFLSHVPSDAPLALLECDWRGVVPDAVMQRYGKQLAERRRKRKTRDRLDDKRRRQAEADSDTRMRAEVLVESEPQEPANINLAALPTLGQRPAPARPAKWVDSQAEFDEMVANAYVPKRGRRKIVISSNH